MWVEEIVHEVLYSSSNNFEFGLSMHSNEYLCILSLVSNITTVYEV